MDQKERSRPPQAAPTINLDDDSVALTADELAERLASRRAEWLRRRDAERADRAERHARRVVGKSLLHGRRRRGGRR